MKGIEPFTWRLSRALNWASLPHPSPDLWLRDDQKICKIKKILRHVHSDRQSRLWTLLYKIENSLSEWLNIVELCAKRLLTSSLYPGEFQRSRLSQVRSTCTRIYIPELFSSSPQWMEDTVHGVHLVLALKHAAVAEFNGGLEPVQTQHQWMAGSHALGTLCKHEPAAQGAAQVLQLAVKG